MPIHDQSYRRYEGHRGKTGRAWMVIARAGIRASLDRKTLLALLLLAWLPCVVRVMQIYAAVSVPQAAFLAPDAGTFHQFLVQQDVFVFFVTVYVGAGLIANDRRANALQIYLSKPLTRFEYVLGKLAVVVTFLLVITWLPAVVLLITQTVLSGNLTFIEGNLSLLPAITLFSIVQALMAGLSVLALSALSRNSRSVGIMYAALLFFSQAVVGVLKSATGNTWWSLISMASDLTQFGDAVFQKPFDGPPWPASCLMILVLFAVSGLILDRRVRGVEVVA